MQAVPEIRTGLKTLPKRMAGTRYRMPIQSLNFRLRNGSKAKRKIQRLISQERTSIVTCDEKLRDETALRFKKNRLGFY